jgi:small GTP-binding protein
MSEINVEFRELADMGETLLKKAHRELSNAPSEKIQDLAGRIPSSIIPVDRKIKVVFAGQYSAGKSTILKVLTNREDIATGAGIITQQTNFYEFDGFDVVDTPGIHTGVRPDHDEIAYRAISDADLLIFVITNELFDSHLAEHFRKLAIEKDKSHEMMLVVNKMSRCVKGNSPEMRDIIREDLRKVLSPFTPDDVRTCFIDAESAIESKNEPDEEVTEILWRKSGMDSFINELNGFVSDKGLAGRYTTALYSLEQALQEALAAESIGDKDIDALEELLLQRRRALLDTKERIPRAVEGEIQRAGTQIRQEGRQIADLIHGSSDPKKVNGELEAAQNHVQLFAEELNQSIQTIIGKQMEELEERVQDIANSEFARELLPRLEHRVKDINISPEMMSNIKVSGDISQRLGKFLVQKSFTLKEGFSGIFNLNHYSGTATHDAVKAVGKFFDYKFKPWEAVKWTRGIANAGRVLAVAGTVLTFVLQIKEDVDAAQLETDLRESRAGIRSGFNEAAHQIEMHYDAATQTYVAETLTKDIAEVDQELSELQEMQVSRSNLFTTILDLLEETRNLIRKLHDSGNLNYEN